MKTKILITFLLAFLFVIPSNGQARKMEIEGDTVIVMTPKDLQTINGIIVDWEFLKVESAMKDSLLQADSLLLDVKDSIIVGIERREAKKEAWYIDQAKKLQKEKKEDKKGMFWFGSSIGLLIGAILGIVL